MSNFELKVDWHRISTGESREVSDWKRSCKVSTNVDCRSATIRLNLVTLDKESQSQSHSRQRVSQESTATCVYSSFLFRLETADLEAGRHRSTAHELSPYIKPTHLLDLLLFIWISWSDMPRWTAFPHLK